MSEYFEKGILCVNPVPVYAEHEDMMDKPKIRIIDIIKIFFTFNFILNPLKNLILLI